jgi:pterin-4a-carbinolamine dehydratase
MSGNYDRRPSPVGGGDYSAIRIAEEMDHHPDIDIRWRTVILCVSTHSAGGLTQMDIEFAQRVDALA